MRLSILPDLKAKVQARYTEAQTQYESAYKKFKTSTSQDHLCLSYWEHGKAAAYLEILKAIKEI